MKRKFAAVTAAFLFAALSACGGDTTSEPSPTTVTVTAEPTQPESVYPPESSIDEAFLGLLRDNTDSWDTLPDTEVITLAEEMCGAWSRGGTFEEIAGIMVDSGFDPYESGFFMGAGTEFYCPEYSDLVNSNA